MKLPVLAINNHRFTLIVMLLLVALGAVSLTSMPRSEDPQFEFPAVLVRVVYPGTNPLDMENLIVDPIEEAINELDDIKVMKSNIEDGLAVIQVEFIYGSDPQDKYDNVVSEVARSRPELPTDIAVLDISKISPIDVNILQVALISEQRDYATLKKLSEDLEKRFERVSGVKRATVEALPEQQVHVLADLAKMKEQGVALEDLLNAVKSSGSNLPGGHVLAGERRFTVRTSGDFKTLGQLLRTPVQSSPGSVIYLENVARVEFADALPSYEARYEGGRAVFVTVIQREGSNIFDVMNGLKTILDDFEQNLPEGISMALAHDQSESVDQQINLLFSNLLQGLILVGLLILMFLGPRPAFVVMLAIPMSVLIGLGGVDIAGYGLQQISIAGLVIALGLLVDNAIVITENVSRFLRDGYSSREAAAKGASQVGWAVVSGTLTTVLAFLPVLGLQTPAGSFLRSMPVTVILTLLASLLIALTLSPLLASLILKPKQAKPTPFLRGIQTFTQGPYKKLLNWSLGNPWKILSGAALVLVGSVMLAGQLGVSLFPKAEKPMMLVNIEMPPGGSFEQTEAMVLRVEEIIKGYPVIRSITSNIGKDNPRIYYNIIPKRQVPNYAQLLVRLHTGDLQTVEPFVDDLRQKFAVIPGAKITVRELLQGPPYEAPVAIRVMGDDLGEVTKVSRDVEKMMLATPGTINIDNPLDKPKIDLHVIINRDKAAMYAVPIRAIDEAVRTSLVGATVSQFRDDDGEDYPIVVRYQGERHPKIEDFERMMVRSLNGSLVPIKQLVSLEMKSALPRFQHHMTERMARVTADVSAGYQTEAVTNDIIEKLKLYQWPDGVRWQVGGEQEQRKESFDGMTKVLLIAMLGIFAVLVLQFNSFAQPAVIFVAIPFAFTGMVGALWLAGFTFSFTAFIGLTSLVGIVVNNSIILVDYANQLRSQGKNMAEAVIESGQTRMLPILLTTMTTIGGLLPLTLSGSVMWAPMGWAIIGGLMTSTVLTLIVVPVLYSLLSSNRSGA